MRLSDLMGKEIVNIHDGVRLGAIGDSDIIIDDETGDIFSILIPDKGGFIGIIRDKGYLEIPWESVRKIGDEIVIIEISEGFAIQKGLL